MFIDLRKQNVPEAPEERDVRAGRMSGVKKVGGRQRLGRPMCGKAQPFR